MKHIPTFFIFLVLSLISALAIGCSSDGETIYVYDDPTTDSTNTTNTGSNTAGQTTNTQEETSQTGTTTPVVIPEAQGSDMFAGKTFVTTDSSGKERYSFGTDGTCTISYSFDGGLTWVDHAAVQYSYNAEKSLVYFKPQKTLFPADIGTYTKYMAYEMHTAATKNLDHYHSYYYYQDERSFSGMQTYTGAYSLVTLEAYQTALDTVYGTIADECSTFLAKYKNIVETYKNSDQKQVYETWNEANAYSGIEYSCIVDGNRYYWTILTYNDGSEILKYADCYGVPKDENAEEVKYMDYFFCYFDDVITKAQSTARFEKARMQNAFNGLVINTYALDEDGQLTLTNQFTGKITDFGNHFTYKNSSSPYPSKISLHTGETFSITYGGTEYVISLPTITEKELSGTVYAKDSQTSTESAYGTLKAIYAVYENGNATTLTLRFTDVPTALADLKGKSVTLAYDESSIVLQQQ